MAEKLQLSYLKLTDITASRSNPRKTFDEKELEELADSIREKGVLQPIIVRTSKKGGYEIIAGERRYRASLLVNAAFKQRNTIPAIIREMSDEEALEIQIIENLQRKDVHPMEEAVGFMHLQQIKKLDVKEIAARVGKSANYVAQRLKLNELIEDLQKAFYASRILVKDAVMIAAMSEEDQGRLYENELDGNDRQLKMDKWSWNRYKHQLNDAPFDINVIIPGAPVKLACTNCPHNSAFNALLFPGEEANPVCLNKVCFEKKCDINYDIQIKAAIEDPTVTLVTPYYSTVTKEKTALIKKGLQVFTSDDYEALERPEIPEREDFEGNNDTEEEDEAEYQEALKDYQNELREYEADRASGKYTKAILIDGDNKGATVFIKITKKGAEKKSTAAAAGNAPSIDESSIKNEIDGIKNREKRAKELDAIKVWDELKKHFNPHANASFLKEELNQLERDAMANAIYNKISYGAQDDFRKLFKIDGRKVEISKVDTAKFNQMLRFFFLDILPPSVLYNSSNTNRDYMISLQLADAYFPSVKKDIETKQNEVAEKRAKRVEARIQKLQQQLKDLKKPKKESVIKDPAAAILKKQAAAKKGKGIKALLTDAQ